MLGRYLEYLAKLRIMGENEFITLYESHKEKIDLCNTASNNINTVNDIFLKFLKYNSEMQ